jgi:hypothetical protein
MGRPGDAPAEPAEPAAGEDVDSGAGVDIPRQRAAPAADQTGLTEREQAILTFERKWWKHAGAKEQAIRDAFDLSATRYYQLLNGLLDNPAALAFEPVVVSRLRRLRSTRSRIRRR